MDIVSLVIVLLSAAVGSSVAAFFAYRQGKIDAMKSFSYTLAYKQGFERGVIAGYHLNTPSVQETEPMDTKEILQGHLKDFLN